MARTVADQFAEILAAAWLSSASMASSAKPQWAYRCDPPEARSKWVQVRHREVDAFDSRREAHMTGLARRSAQEVRTGQRHLIQCLFDARSRVQVLAIDGPHIPIGEIGSGISRRRTRRRVQGMQPLLRDRLRRPPDAALARDRHPRGGAKRGVSVIVMPATSRARRRSDARSQSGDAVTKGPYVVPGESGSPIGSLRPQRSGRVTICARSGLPHTWSAPDGMTSYFALGERLKARW